MPQIMEPKVRDPCCERRSEGPRHQLQWPIFALEYISCGKASHLRQTLKRGPHVLRYRHLSRTLRLRIKSP